MLYAWVVIFFATHVKHIRHAGTPSIKITLRLRLMFGLGSRLGWYLGAGTQ